MLITSWFRTFQQTVARKLSRDFGVPNSQRLNSDEFSGG